MRHTLSDGHTAEVLLFRDVKNAKAIVADMLRGGFNAAFVNPDLIPEMFPLLVAVSSALRRDATDDKVTRNIYTEIIYQLAPSRNISTALKTFGINDSSTAFLAVVPNPSADDLDKLRSAINGTESETIEADLLTMCDMAKIRKVYTIDNIEYETSSVVDSIVTRMACRDIK